MDPDERRRKQREAMRRLRAKRARAKREAGWTFEAICSVMRIQISPQSSLNPENWRGFTLFDDLDLRKKPVA